MRMRWMGHVTHMGEIRNVLGGKPETKRPLRRPGIDGMIILEWILGK
jgi:hypothetical protein